LLGGRFVLLFGRLLLFFPLALILRLVFRAPLLDVLFFLQHLPIVNMVVQSEAFLILLLDDKFEVLRTNEPQLLESIFNLLYN